MRVVEPMVEVVTGFGGATPIDKLTIVALTTNEQLDLNDSATIRAKLPFATPVTQRTMVRIYGVDGVVREGRVRRRQFDPLGAWCDLEIGSALLDLSACGTISALVGGAVQRSFGGERTGAAWMTEIAFPSLPVSVTSWLDTTLGAIESTQTVTLQFTNWTPLQLIRAVSSALGLEPYLYQPSAGAKWRLAMLTQRGASAGRIEVSGLRNALEQQIDGTDDGLTAIVQPIGAIPPGSEEPASIADHLWSVVTALPSNWLQIGDPSGGPWPIPFDDMLVGTYLTCRINNALVRRQVLDARAQDSAVQLSDVTGIGGGMRVWFVQDADGTPLTTLRNPAAVTEFGELVVPIESTAWRGERNELTNGGFEAGFADWTEVNATGAAVPMDRDDFGVTIIAAVNGARSAGTGTGTPLGVDGLDPFAPIYAGDQLKIGGAILPITADVIASATGVLVIGVGGSGLPGNQADNTPVTLQRADVRTLLLDGAQSKHGGAATSADSSGRYYRTLQFRDSQTDFLDVAGGLGVFGAPLGNDASLFPKYVRLEYSGVAWWVQSAEYLTGSAGKIRVLIPPAGTTVGLGPGPFYDTGQIAWTSGPFSGLPSTLPDGASFTLTIPRETRTLYLDGAHINGATSLTFKAQSILACRHFASSDVLTLQRAISVSAVITATTIGTPTYDAGTGTFFTNALCTLDTSASTIDDVSAGDFLQSVVNGSFIYLTTAEGDTWRVTDVSGGVMGLARSSLSSVAPTIAAQTITVDWRVTDTYSVTGTGTWASSGQVTVPISIPSGRSYVRGAIAGGTGGDLYAPLALLRVKTAVSGSASSIVLEGSDAYRSFTTDPTVAQQVRVYRVFASGSTLPIPGEICTAAATAVANGSGAATVTLTAANTNAIADNLPLTISRLAMIPIGDRMTGSALRLRYAVGNGGVPTMSSPGAQSSAQVLFVPPGSTRIISAWARFALSPTGYSPAGGPAIALVKVDTAEIIATASLPSGTTTVTDTPGVFTLLAPILITESGVYAVRVFGGSQSSNDAWCVALEAMLVMSAATDVTYTPDSKANAGWHIGTRWLAAYRREVKGFTVDVADLTMMPLTVQAAEPWELGAVIDATDVGESFRIVAIQRDHFDITRTKLTLDSLARTAARLLGTGRASAGSGSVLGVSGGSSSGVGGSGIAECVTLSSDATITMTNGLTFVALDGTIQSVRATLPPAASVSGKRVIAKLVALPFKGTLVAADLIDGLPELDLEHLHEHVTVLSNGATYSVV